MGRRRKGDGRASLGSRLEILGTHALFDKVDREPEIFVSPERFGEARARIGVPAKTPFLPELLKESGTRREQLAKWITHDRNKPFARAAVNRVWALLIGKPLLMVAEFHQEIVSLGWHHRAYTQMGTRWHDGCLRMMTGRQRIQC